ncbi:MAG: methylmalonyl-CoA epimerase [Vicinamibacterales bacterium]|jgi:methylmalonyl-CoA epimerase|nr:methylmalonyl-CoA epimerase [Vicinamibacterales bacterium]MDP7671290.1 methylmalonyl-CoA epimerase [Vicinamibacterales bacterium]HJO38856.1 methylmalonyl-CoA epimerase [Vicinamibacterales bacterium]|tara:strand:+ start:61 stop:471 length:411 start_codon:yes stop_codon:yes gene_type:complete
MKVSLDHVGIAVQDLEAALRFFRDALGLEVSAPESVATQRVRVTEAEAGGPTLEFLEATDSTSPVGRFLDQRGPGLHHITLAVDDLTGTLEHLRAHGVTLIDEQPRLGVGGSRIAFVHPASAHGVLVELKQVDPGT